LPQRFGLAAAQSLNEAGRLEESLGVLQKLPEAARDLRYFSAQGATLQQLNQHAAAVTAFDAALQLAPGNAAQLPSLLVAQAVSMQAVGKRAQAQQNFERVQQMADVASELREFAAREIKSK
jgi:tetratricopeptide (TPR) repeat protein